MENKTKHTADHIHNPSYCCSCTIEHNGKVESIKYCALHCAAPELLDTLHKIKRDINWLNLGLKTMELIESAIAKAEGR